MEVGDFDKYVAGPGSPPLPNILQCIHYVLAILGAKGPHNSHEQLEF